MFLMCSMFYYSHVMAHVGGHNEITASQAIELAYTTTKKMAFKDMGYGTGKLDESWSNVEKSNFSISEIKSNNYVVKGVNENNGEEILLTIDVEGLIIDISMNK